MHQSVCLAFEPSPATWLERELEKKEGCQRENRFVGGWLEWVDGGVRRQRMESEERIEKTTEEGYTKQDAEGD